MNTELHTSMLTAIYASDLASDATYSNESGLDFALSVVFKQSDNADLGGADIGVRGTLTTARVRVSELDQPKKNDLLHVHGGTWRVDGYDRLNQLEWLLYVIA